MSLTFPSAGFYSVRVAFEDNAGEAALGVSVGSPLPPTDFFFDAKRKKIDKKGAVRAEAHGQEARGGQQAHAQGARVPEGPQGQEPDEVDQHELHGLRLTGERVATGHTCGTRE